MTFQQSNYLNPKLYGHKYETNMTLGDSNTTNGTGSGVSPQALSGFYVVQRLDAGTTTTGSATSKYGTLTIGGGEMWVKCGTYMAVLSTAAEEFMVEVGIHDGNATTVISDGVYFRYDRLTSANWLAISESGSTETSTDTLVSVKATTEEDLQVHVNSDKTIITYYINDELVATHTTNIPSVVNTEIAFSIIKSAGTTSRKVFGLYFEYLQKRS